MHPQPLMPVPPALGRAADPSRAKRAMLWMTLGLVLVVGAAWGGPVVVSHYQSRACIADLITTLRGDGEATLKWEGWCGFEATPYDAERRDQGSRTLSRAERERLAMLIEGTEYEYSAPIEYEGPIEPTMAAPHEQVSVRCGRFRISLHEYGMYAQDPDRKGSFSWRITDPALAPIVEPHGRGEEFIVRIRVAE